MENKLLMNAFEPKEGRRKRELEKTTQLVALCFVLLTTYHSGNQIKKTEIGGT